MAIAHKLALIIYRNLRDDREYQEPAPRLPSERSKQKILQSRIKDLERLGYKVIVEQIKAVS
jgi:hypothetical protein